MEPIQMLDVVQGCAQAVIDQVSSEHHGLGSTCEGWDVAMLLDKMVRSADLFAVLCSGGQPGPDLNLLFPTAIGPDNPSGAFAQAAARCRAAFGESALEGEMMGPLGVMVPRRGGLDVRMMDCTLNTWDLARSIGVEHGIDDETAAPLVEFARTFIPEVREKTGPDRFGAAAHEGPTDSVVGELVALSGRDPAWSPSS